MRVPGRPLEIFVITARHGPIFPRRDGITLEGSVGGVSMSGMDVDAKHVFDPQETGPWEYDLRPSEWGRNFILERVLKVIPALEDAEVVDHLAGVRPLCADRMPLIGPVPGWGGGSLPGHRPLHQGHSPLRYYGAHTRRSDGPGQYRGARRRRCFFAPALRLPGRMTGLTTPPPLGGRQRHSDDRSGVQQLQGNPARASSRKPTWA